MVMLTTRKRDVLLLAMITEMLKYSTLRLTAYVGTLIFRTESVVLNLTELIS